MAGPKQYPLTARVRTGQWGQGKLGAPSPGASVAWQPHPMCPHRWQCPEGPLVPSTVLMGTVAWAGTHSLGDKHWPGTAQSPAI